MTTPNLFVSAPDASLIRAIVERAGRAGLVRSPNYPALSAMMDLTACHANGCPLDLPGLLAADDANFTHDIVGIAKHLDRETGRLKDWFLPRFTVPESADAEA